MIHIVCSAFAWIALPEWPHGTHWWGQSNISTYNDFSSVIDACVEVYVPLRSCRSLVRNSQGNDVTSFLFKTSILFKRLLLKKASFVQTKPVICSKMPVPLRRGIVCSKGHVICRRKKTTILRARKRLYELRNLVSNGRRLLKECSDEFFVVQWRGKQKN